jgi:transposase
VLPDFPQHSSEDIFQGPDPACYGRSWQSPQRGTRDPSQYDPTTFPPYSPELNPQENIWDEIREKIFKNYALKSMDEVNDKLDEAALYIKRNQKLVKSITSFPYIAKSF